MEIMSFFEMFDKVDDLVYAPISVICDGIRQPLKQLDAATERKKMELSHKLDTEMQMLGVNLEIDRKKRNAEIEQWIEDQELERREKIFKDIEQYQKNMETVAVEIGEAICNLSIESQAKAQDMIIEKTKKFKDLEIEALNEARQGVKEIQMMFPDDEAIRMEMMKPYQEMMMNVVRNTNAFILDLKKSTEKLADNINQITNKIIENTNKYIEPLCGGKLTGIESNESKNLYNGRVDYIEEK